MSAQANLYLHRTYLEKVLEQRPTRGKSGYLQDFIWNQFFKWQEFGSRNILMERGKQQNQIAGLAAPEGQALPRPRVSGDTFLSTMMDVKSYAMVKSDIVQADFQLGELMLKGALGTSLAGQMQQKVTSYIAREMKENVEVVDNMLEYLAIGALKNSIVWPPVDDAGSAISPAPRYWGAEISGTWNVGLATELNQVVSSLVDYNGDSQSGDLVRTWDDDAADIIGQLDIVDQICKNNHAFSIRGGTIICRSSLSRDLMSNTDILTMLRGTNSELTGARGFITTKQLEDWFVDGVGYTFRPYDTFWTYESLTADTDYTPTLVHYLRENEIIIVPPQGIQGMMGTIPLETETGAYQSGGGPMAWLYKRPKPPFEREMGVHTVAWPLFQDNLMWVRLQVKA